MNEDEAKYAYDGISEVLRREKLQWVLEQVEESATLGKTTTVEADASEFFDKQVAGQRRGKPKMQEFVTTQALSNLERLVLLLDAIDRVMALPQFAFHSVKTIEATSVTFVSETDGDEGLTLAGRPDEQTEEPRLRLRKLREEIGAPAT